MTQVEPEDEEPIEAGFAQSRRLLSFKAAMILYVVLAVLGTVTLTGKFRIFILIVLAGVAMKTYVHHLKERVE
ncbi:MAG: hypothetical protein WBW33_28285 [Bryobacteraceae bacterium]